MRIMMPSLKSIFISLSQKYLHLVTKQVSIDQAYSDQRIRRGFFASVGDGVWDEYQN